MLTTGQRKVPGLNLIEHVWYQLGTYDIHVGNVD